MDEIDNRLQKNLETLDPGQVGPNPNGDDQEFEALVLLAASIREVAGPHMSPEKVRSGKQQVMNAALASDQVIRHRSKRGSSNRLAWLAIGLIPVTLVLAFLIPLTLVLIGGGLYWNDSRVAGQVALENARGQVSITEASDPASWEPVESGIIRDGARVRTGSASSVTLIFHEGSRVELGPETEIRLDQVRGGWGGKLSVALSQNSGSSLHQVIPLQGDGSSYIVHTPAGTTEVHGTTFSVEVGASGDSRVLVESGQVTVVAAGEEVVLLAGQATAASVGLSPEPPAYQFSGEGEISAINGTTWVIGGVPVTVIDQTTIIGDPVVGDMAAIKGRILDGGLWLADEIKRLDESRDSSFSFSGRLESMDRQFWVIGGNQVRIIEGTKIDGDPRVGDAVKVTFSVQDDGSWLALRISNLDDDDREPTPTPSATPDPNANPSLAFEPDELEQSGCADSFTFTGTLVNTADGDNDYAANVELGYTLIKNPQFVSAVTIDPSSWGVIPAGEMVNFDVQVDLTETWATVPDGTEVKLGIFVAYETNRPGQHRTRLTLTIASDCRRTPTPTVTITPTMTITPSITPTPRATPTPPGPTDCTGANPHPHGMTLAQRYGVPYEEIMSWFCQGFGFGEIEHAYTLSLESGVPVAEIFGMRRSGLGWGQIKKQLTNGGKPKKK